MNLNIILDTLHHLEYFYLLKRINNNQTNCQVYCNRPWSKILKLADFKFLTRFHMRFASYDTPYNLLDIFENVI